MNEKFVQSSKSTASQYQCIYKFDRNPQINSQNIEHKQNSEVDQGQ